MTKSTIELVKLTAAEGMTLTNGETYGKEIYLGCNDTADNWSEITDSEAEALQEESLQDEMLSSVEEVVNNV